MAFGVVVSEFNKSITDNLLTHCLKALEEKGVPSEKIKVVRVPGAFELPLACQRLAQSKKYDAVIALGCVIRGETPHDHYINHAVSQGLQRVALDTNIPVIFGVLTTLTEEQAYARSAANSHNKGRESALAALSMAEKPWE
jgi:6,7-dimethyl-8-ribityllumazine synthase